MIRESLINDSGNEFLYAVVDVPPETSLYEIIPYNNTRLPERFPALKEYIKKNKVQLMCFIVNNKCFIIDAVPEKLSTPTSEKNHSNFFLRYEKIYDKMYGLDSEEDNITEESFNSQEEHLVGIADRNIQLLDFKTAQSWNEIGNAAESISVEGAMTGYLLVKHHNDPFFTFPAVYKNLCEVESKIIHDDIMKGIAL